MPVEQHQMPVYAMLYCKRFLRKISLTNNDIFVMSSLCVMLASSPKSVKGQLEAEGGQKGPEKRERGVRFWRGDEWRKLTDV